MPLHEFICRDCNDTLYTQVPIGEDPDTPYCPIHQHLYSRVYSFNAKHIPIEITSSGVGKHGSVRSYKTALSKLSDEHTERIGRQVSYEPIDE
jgi:hypothetical protein